MGSSVVVSGLIARLRRTLPFLAVTAFPLVSAVRVLAGTGPGPVLYGDDALIGVAARSFPQLLGPYSRDGFHHPGPALFYLLAPFSESSRLLVVGALTINAAALLGVVAVVRSRCPDPDPAGLWAAVVLDLFGLGIGAGTFRSPWNPYLVILPMVLFVTLWAADHSVWALVVGSYCVQTHLSTAPVVLVLTMAGARGLRVRSTGWLVLVAMWIPPLIEFHNLGAIWHFFAVRHSPAGLIGLVVIASAALVAGAPRSFTDRLVVAGITLAVIGGLSLLFADGPVQRYFVLWLADSPVALGLAWAARRRRSDSLPALPSALAVGAVLAAVAVASTATAIERTSGDGPWPEADRSAHPKAVSDTARFDQAALAAVRGHDRATLVFADRGLWPYAAGIVWALDSHGVTTSVPGWPLYFSGRAPAGVQLGLYPASGAPRGAALATVDGTVLVLTAPPVSTPRP